MQNSLDEQIQELIKKADEAQRRGDYQTMKQYDTEIRALQEKKWMEFQKAIDPDYGKEQDEEQKTL